MENITLPTILIIGVLVVLLLFVSRQRDTLFSPKSKGRVKERRSQGTNWGLGNAVGEPFSAGRTGEFEGARKLK